MNRISIALSLPVGAALLLQANPSHALTISVGGNPYEIEFFTGSLTDLLASTTSPIAPPSSSFPWFGDGTFTSQFSDAFFAQEGSSYQQLIQDAVSGDVTVGPLFIETSSIFVAYDFGAGASTGFTCDTASAIDCEQPIYWAYVPVPAAAPVPAPLPLFGAAAAFSFSRKLRRRLSAQKFTF
jgi:hypothetical protein